MDEAILPRSQSRFLARPPLSEYLIITKGTTGIVPSLCI